MAKPKKKPAPSKKNTGKKTMGKKTPQGKNTPKKTTAKHPPAKKTTAGKHRPAKKTAPGKKPAKKAPGPKTGKPAKKPMTQKTTAKKTPPRKKNAPARKTPLQKKSSKKKSAKKSVAKRTTSPSKKPATKKAAPPTKPTATRASRATSKTQAPVPSKKKTTPAKTAGTPGTRPPKKPPAPPNDKTPSAKPGKKTIVTKPAATPSAKNEAKANARDLLRSRILGNKKQPGKPIAFSLEEVREIAKKTSTATAEGAAKPAASVRKPVPVDFNQPAAPSHVKAASLADIFGFNPKQEQKTAYDDPAAIPEKFRRYYKLLIDLRQSLTEGLSLHTEETLKRSNKDDAGDLSSYGQHMADAGTDTFDRDFALSMVASEQEALTEIDAAIKRIKDGTYGICEVTGKPIAKERLHAVPFTRYSTEAQKDIEKNRMRVRTAAGLFGELGGDDAGRHDDGDDE
ncbi:MAG: TraR/DksA C4-type zinc finger protein [Opitutaceae bacterium]|jgi:RNA polymerase-binding transcription factor DksA|nr:TraR/DksA C4-type zinc finger protein [Opitutaceae bacterium]